MKHINSDTRSTGTYKIEFRLRIYGALFAKKEPQAEQVSCLLRANKFCPWFHLASERGLSSLLSSSCNEGIRWFLKKICSKKISCSKPKLRGALPLSHQRFSPAIFSLNVPHCVLFPHHRIFCVYYSESAEKSQGLWQSKSGKVLFSRRHHKPFFSIHSA